ncbi:1,4-alpha-glucan branching protein GlgB [Paeniglutamicibacter antarcticus]|uniref:1,4-alpha-glucan branching enzyme GlgB n=1 Tax=Arthrobacter terrae TaxID=2935737 RepID=A0A931CS84_9MICC|nr:1,4-alpha-glucan branching protein GlgB [Arthrobacter terrae]MBG0741660.1 1,4-alpha-glucan branching protein GlgB [Arthrobacter terrae]
MHGLTAGIAELLTTWLPDQRWYPAKGSTVALHSAGGFRLADSSPDKGADAGVGLEVHFIAVDDGNRTQVLQVPLSFRSAPLAGADAALVAEIEDPALGRLWIYDAPHDQVFISAWLDLLRGSSTVTEGTATAFSSPTFGESRREDLGDARVLSSEQSNTSVIVQNADKPVIIKFFRVLGAGVNPDVEVGAALTAAGCGEVPALHGWATGSWSGTDGPVEGNLAVMHEFVPDSEDVWAVALKAARAGDDFAAQASAIGAATARVHRSLLSSMGSHQVAGSERDAFVEGIASRIRWAWSQAGEVVGPYRDRIEEIISSLYEVKDLPPLQRIHGDLHLGQLLHADTKEGERWLVLDFEGEPLRPVAERNRPDLPLRDVVGMLRSFDYAAASADDGRAAEADRTAAWAEAASAAFIRGYQGVEPGAIETDSALFRALWLDKALYEVVYELRNRPAWMHVPVRAVRKTLNAMESGDAMGSTGSEDNGQQEQSGAREQNGAQEQSETANGLSEARRPLAVDSQVLARVSDGTYYAPHSVLGAHLDANGLVTIRTLRHLAESAAVVTVDGKFPMTHEYGGIWTAVLDPAEPGHVPDYRLEVGYHGGKMATADDPYRYLPTLGEIDLHLIGEGRHETLWTALGAHVQHYHSELGSVTGVSFAVWAPNAQAVRVKGDFNNWDGRQHAMRSLGSSGIWEIFTPDVMAGACYKFEILAKSGEWVEKADPMAFGTEVPPLTASRVVESGYAFKDEDWIAGRAARDPHNSAMSVYEVHLGSWRLGLDYRDLAKELVEYASWMGFTHVELMPVAEHPFGGSWGYQVTSYYAPTSRFGHPDEFRFLVDSLHQAGIGVIMDWVPAHFPKDAWALARFDGQPLYEHSNPQLGEHPDWGTLIFDFGRSEVRNFLVANALYWFEEFHIDGLRVDAVASMLYLDYSREAGQWSPNKFGGRENLEAISLLQEVNATSYKRYPGIVMIAEESTAFPGVTAPTSGGGLGFGLKWNMGWMHDSLAYIAEDPVNRGWHHNEATFSLVYAFTENFLLPISHDEVVHGKGSMLRKMPGDRWQQLANLRAYLAYQWAHPGKQLIFMGTEFGQEAEWSEQHGLDWWLADMPPHRGLQLLVRRLNEQYRATAALYARDNDPEGFEWINGNDAQRNVLSFIRWDGEGNPLVCLANFAGTPIENFRVGMPAAGEWSEVVNTDAKEFGGSGVGNSGTILAEDEGYDGKIASATLTLPPLAVLYLVPVRP